MSERKSIGQIYNPHQQRPQELIDSFVVRLEKFQQIFREIREARMEDPEQHLLIIGQRGMGKTTMLLRLSFEAERDPNLTPWLIPLVFTEEQYSITALYGLWEQVAKYLEDKHSDYLGLFERMDQHYSDDHEAYERLCFRMLTQALQTRKQKVLLFIDNIGDILKKFRKQESQRLREVLMTSADIRIIGASATMLESFFSYDQPFYEFFKSIYLQGLNQEETQILLLKLGEYYHEDALQHILEHDPGRIEALRRLTGGVIRTIILLFEIFVDNEYGNAFQDLQKILDRVTPLYKHRMDDLPVQQQQIVDVIAHAWDAVATKEIARKTRLESKKVSAQLKQLKENGIINIVHTDTKNHLYQLKERFFNIWYLMRNGRRYDKQRVIWLTRFLEDWCDPPALTDRIRKHLSSLSSGSYDPEAAYFLSEAMARTTHISLEEQDELLQKTREYLSFRKSEWTEHLSRSDKELGTQAEQLYDQKQYEKALMKLQGIIRKTGDVYLNLGLCYLSIQQYDQAEEAYLQAIEAGESGAWLNLGNMYCDELKDFDQAETAYQNAIAAGETSAWVNLGNLYCDEHKDFTQAEAAYRKALTVSEAKAWFNLGNMYYMDLKDLAKAEHAYQQAVQSGETEAWLNLGLMYRHEMKDYAKAQEAYQKAIEAGNVNAWLSLGNMYSDDLSDYSNAREAYLKAIEVGLPNAWLRLGRLYQQHFRDLPKAEAAYLKAVEVGETKAWLNLGLMYRHDLHDYEKAETAFYQAIQAGVKKVWINLGHMFFGDLGDFEKAEEAYKKAIEAGDHEGLVGMADLILDREANLEKAEKLFLEADKQGVEWALNNMAYEFYKHKKDKQKTLVYAKAGHQKWNHPYTSATLAKALLWNNQFEESFEVANQFLFEDHLLEERYEDYVDYLLLLLAKGQYELIKNYFESDRGKAMHAKERLKPIWYALAYFLQGESPLEYLRMGPELQETVKEIIDRLEEMRIDYA